MPNAAVLASAVLLAFAASISSAHGASAPAPVTHTVTSSLQWGACPAIFPAGCQIAVLNGDPSKPNADIFLRVPAGYKIPAHSHSSAERMILVEGKLSVQYQGAPLSILKSGTYAYGPAGLPHEAKCLSKTRCTLFIAFEGPVDANGHDGSLK
jgi:quercetin dioxygenase-like cupin family protein